MNVTEQDIQEAAFFLGSIARVVSIELLQLSPLLRPQKDQDTYLQSLLLKSSIGRS